MKLVHWPLMGGLLHLVQREGDQISRTRQYATSKISNIASTVLYVITID